MDNGGMQFLGGEQQMLVIVWGLLMNLKLLIFDELIEGLVLIIVKLIYDKL